MQTYTIEELDRLDDDTICRMASQDVVLDAGDEGRGQMVIAHEAWTASLEEDLQDCNWSTALRTNWDLYAELRINGVYFERAVVAAPTMSM